MGQLVLAMRSGWRARQAVALLPAPSPDLPPGAGKSTHAVCGDSVQGLGSPTQEAAGSWEREIAMPRTGEPQHHETAVPRESPLTSQPKLAEQWYLST